MRTIIAVASLVASVAFAQADVYDHGVYKGRASKLDFQGGLSATVVGGKASIDGGGSGGAGWVTAFECDLTAESNQTLGSDTTYTICGKTWTKQSSAGDGTAMAIVNGSGLRIIPASASDLWSTTRTAPRLHIGLSALVPSFVAETPVRMTIYQTGNWAANYDSSGVVLWTKQDASTFSWARVYRIFNASAQIGIHRVLQNTNATEQVTTIFGTPDVYRLTYPGGVGENHFFMSTATYASGFPADTAFKPFAAYGPGDVLSNAPSAGLSGYEMALYASRAGSGTALSVDIKRVKVEYGSGSGSGGGGAPLPFLWASKAAAQTTNVALEDHLKIDVVREVSGSDISLDTATTYTSQNNVASVGRFTVAGGHCYRMTGACPEFIWTGANTFATIQWTNADNGELINPTAEYVPKTEGGASDHVGTTDVIVCPSATTRYELRITAKGSDAIVSIGGSGPAADGGTIHTFPFAVIQELN